MKRSAVNFWRLCVILSGFLIFLNACNSDMELSTVQNLDITRYSGTWYEIARLPNRFERGLTCITATYTLKDNGKIRVTNRGFKASKGKFEDINGSARVPDSKFPGQLKVTFFWPFSGNYYVMALDDDYRYALVGDPSRKYLWILCRDKELDPVIYQQLVQLAASNGFEVEQLERTPQDCS